MSLICSIGKLRHICLLCIVNNKILYAVCTNKIDEDPANKRMLMYSKGIIYSSCQSQFYFPLYAHCTLSEPDVTNLNFLAMQERISFLYVCLPFSVIFPFPPSPTPPPLFPPTEAVCGGWGGEGGHRYIRERQADQF